MKLYKFIETKHPSRVALTNDSTGNNLPKSACGWTADGTKVVTAGATGRIGLSDDQIIKEINTHGYVVR